MNAACGWLSVDDGGRPACSHGPAVSNGGTWICRDANRRKRRRYRATDLGREQRRRDNASPHRKSSKALYHLTYVKTEVR